MGKDLASLLGCFYRVKSGLGMVAAQVIVVNKCLIYRFEVFSLSFFKIGSNPMM